MTYFLYNTAVELFMYAAMSPSIDLAFAVNTTSRYMCMASPPHWMVIKCTMRYLKGTLDYKLCLGCKNIVWKGFCDVDWTKDANIWRSTTRCIFFSRGWSYLVECKKQPTVEMSTMEMEYIIIHCMKEVIWVRQLLAYVGFVEKVSNIHHMWQLMMYSVWKESQTPFVHKTYRYIQHFI